MSIFEPWAGKRIGEFSPPKLPNLNPQQFKKTAKVEEEPTDTQPVTLSEEPKMEQPTPVSSGKIPVKHTRAYPKMQKKQTAPGTKPKKR